MESGSPFSTPALGGTRKSRKSSIAFGLMANPPDAASDSGGAGESSTKEDKDSSSPLSRGPKSFHFGSQRQLMSRAATMSNTVFNEREKNQSMLERISSCMKRKASYEYDEIDDMFGDETLYSTKKSNLVAMKSELGKLKEGKDVVDPLAKYQRSRRRSSHFSFGLSAMNSVTSLDSPCTSIPSQTSHSFRIDQEGLAKYERTDLEAIRRTYPTAPHETRRSASCTPTFSMKMDLEHDETSPQKPRQLFPPACATPKPERTPFLSLQSSNAVSFDVRKLEEATAKLSQKFGEANSLERFNPEKVVERIKEEKKYLPKSEYQQRKEAREEERRIREQVQQGDFSGSGLFPSISLVTPPSASHRSSQHRPSQLQIPPQEAELDEFDKNERDFIDCFRGSMEAASFQLPKLAANRGSPVVTAQTGGSVSLRGNDTRSTLEAGINRIPVYSFEVKSSPDVPVAGEANEECDELLTPRGATPLSSSMEQQQAQTIAFSPALSDMKRKLAALEREDAPEEEERKKKRSLQSMDLFNSGRFKDFGEMVDDGAAEDAPNSKASVRHPGRARRAIHSTGKWLVPQEIPFVSALAEYEVEATTPMITELDTNIPMQDLHIYSIFCAKQKMTIILRPVSISVPNLYAGTAMLAPRYCDQNGQPIPQPEMPLEKVRENTRFECRVKGKSINVSLKSSSYPPIDGLIPVNPALGKAYLDAQRREREIEDMILNAQGGVMTIKLLRKLKAQKSQAGSLTAAFVRDINKALENSDKKCAKVLEEYTAETMLSIDKEGVSRKYIDVLNESQFLGTTEATWRGLSVYYTDVPGAGVLRDEKEVPIFHVKKEGEFYKYDSIAADLEKRPTQDIENLKPVLVVTHRTFFISETTHRIEEDPSSFLIGPDFDGLSYGTNIHTHDASWDCDQHLAFAEEQTKPELTATMGLVSQSDIEHVMEMRTLTEWKQNHGYECGNTVKSQPISHGHYTVITPTNVRLLYTFEEIIAYYRKAWIDGTPLLLNPNWKVAIKPEEFLPSLLGDELALPIIDDCGYATLVLDLESSDVKISVQGLVALYTSMEERVEKERDAQRMHYHKQKTIVGQNVSMQLVDDMELVYDKKRVAQLFYDLRRWQLLPPYFDDPNRVDEDGTQIPNRDFEFIRYEKVQERIQEYERVVELFKELHTSSTFCKMIEMYVYPSLADLHTGATDTSFMDSMVKFQSLPPSSSPVKS